MSKGIKKIASVALPIVGGAFGPVGAAIGGAAGGAISGGGLKGIALGAATGYGGNAIGSSLGSTLSGTLGKAGGATLGNTIGKAAGTLGPVSGASIAGASNALTNTLANTTLSKAIGSFAGNSLANSVGESFMGSEEPETAASGPSPYSPSRDPQMEMPSSLSSFGTLAPEQISSNLATQGVYGGGNGPQETNYFTNLINRRLIDDSGGVDSDLSEITPIESSYLSQLGLGGYGDARSLLEALNRRKNAVPA